jgi:hypothetical protein
MVPPFFIALKWLTVRPPCRVEAFSARHDARDKDGRLAGARLFNDRDKR